MRDEPGSLEVLLTVIMGNLFSRVYKEYVDRSGLKGNERVLDLNCGAGNLARFLAQALQRGNGQLTCTDVSQIWMQVAQKRLSQYSNIHFCLGDITTLDLPDETFDVVFIDFVLHEIDAADCPAIVRQLTRKLKKDGKLFIREPQSFISLEEISFLTQRSGLIEIDRRIGDIPTQGSVYEGVFCRPHPSRN